MSPDLFPPSEAVDDAKGKRESAFAFVSQNSPPLLVACKWGQKNRLPGRA
jgi:hypothetical protein